MPTTLHNVFIKGTPLVVPNRVTEGKGYYVSYNNYDRRIYGCDTTAIVIDSTGAFLILNGDHRKAVDGMTLAEVCAYFHANADKKSKMSDPDENYRLILPVSR